MDRKEILEKLEDLAQQAGELKDSLDIAACLRVLILGATKGDTFLLKFMKVYSNLYYSEEDQDIWEKLRQKALRTKDRDIALQIRGFLMNVLHMSPRDPGFSNIKKEVMSDPPVYDLFFKLLQGGDLSAPEIKIFQIREVVETYIKNRSIAHQR